MGPIRKFFVRDVRCFEGEHSFAIRPLTFVIGENSTGKSTLLGCFHALRNYLDHRTPDVNFNSEPYQMGAFSDIVRRSRPAKGEFELGVEALVDNGATVKFVTTFTEEEGGSGPCVKSVRWIFVDGEVALIASQQGLEESERFQVTQPMLGHFRIEWNVRQLDSYVLWQLWHAISRATRQVRTESDDAATKLREFMEEKHSGDIGSARGYLFSDFFDVYSGSVYSVAPVRSMPKRTYDPLKETETPDGSEIPVWLMNLSLSRQEVWGTLRQSLAAFGKASGLFADIAVRKLGGARGDPFQLQIKVSGPRVNLVDVGYGVSQVLPIVVRVLTGTSVTFLLQQPEVHLHPKGQAELSSLLVEVCRSQGNSFVIETHSDHMIDRVRIEIRKGRIAPEDVALVYLEPDGGRVKTHHIGFDRRGNLTDVPRGYRQFFLSEADCLLGLSD